MTAAMRSSAWARRSAWMMVWDPACVPNGSGMGDGRRRLRPGTMSPSTETTPMRCRAGQVSGRRQIALVDQCQHLGSSNLSRPMHKVVLAHGLTDLGQRSGRTGHISLDEFQTGQKHLTENESVNNVLILSRQLEALLSVLLGGIQVVPFVEYAGQAEMCFAGIRQRLITSQLDTAPVGLGRQIELVFCFLYAAQTIRGQYSMDRCA
jgi:hypothetical protein